MVKILQLGGVLALALGLVGCEKSEKVYWEDGKTLRAEYSYVKGRYEITLCDDASPRIVAKDVSLRELKCYYKNGQLSYEKEFNGDKEQGYVQVGVGKGYYENGQMRYETHYNSKGKQHGVDKGWYENGQLQSEESYKDGKKDGVFKEWREDGSLSSESHYKNDKLDGISKEWNKDGSLYKEWHYKNGKVVK